MRPRIATSVPVRVTLSWPIASARVDSPPIVTVARSAMANASVLPPDCPGTAPPIFVPTAPCTRRSENPVRAKWIAMEAAAVTDHSKEEATGIVPLPAWASDRTSSSTVARLCQGCSSRRTINSPVLAVARQWTRRRSSPRWYSRVATSSSPDAATDEARPSPPPVQSPPNRLGGNCHRVGVTSSSSLAVKDRVSSQKPKGSVSRTDSGPIR
jgi:hypothetical protein